MFFFFSQPILAHYLRPVGAVIGVIYIVVPFKIAHNSYSASAVGRTLRFILHFIVPVCVTLALNIVTSCKLRNGVRTTRSERQGVYWAWKGGGGGGGGWWRGFAGSHWTSERTSKRHPHQHLICCMLVDLLRHWTHLLIHLPPQTLPSLHLWRQQCWVR